MEVKKMWKDVGLVVTDRDRRDDKLIFSLLQQDTDTKEIRIVEC